MRCSIVWMSVLRSSLRCCSSSSSVSPSQVQTLFRSEFSCCHCCWFCFVRISLLRSWACRSSQRSITPRLQRVREQAAYAVSYTINQPYMHAGQVVVWRYLTSGTQSCWDLPVQTRCLPPPSAHSPSSSLCQYCRDTLPAAASTEYIYSDYNRYSRIGWNILTRLQRFLNLESRNIHIPCMRCPVLCLWACDCGCCPVVAGGSGWHPEGERASLTRQPPL